MVWRRMKRSYLEILNFYLFSGNFIRIGHFRCFYCHVCPVVILLLTSGYFSKPHTQSYGRYAHNDTRNQIKEEIKKFPRR